MGTFFNKVTFYVISIYYFLPILSKFVVVWFKYFSTLTIEAECYSYRCYEWAKRNSTSQKGFNNMYTDAWEEESAMYTCLLREKPNVGFLWNKRAYIAAGYFFCIFIKNITSKTIYINNALNFMNNNSNNEIEMKFVFI